MAKVLSFPVRAGGRQGRTLESKTSLTELRIEKLKVTGVTYYTNDGAQPGLSVRVSAGGVKAFVFTKHQHGRLTRITLGRVGALRLDAARRAAQELHGDISRGVDVAERKRNARQRDVASETMQDAFERFMSAKARRPTTMRDYQSLWLLHTPAALKHKTVRNPEIVRMVVAKVLTQRHFLLVRPLFH
jgi:hypothetical protein